MTTLGLLLLVQLCLSVAFGLAVLTERWLSPRDALWAHRALLVGALVLPFAVSALPVAAPWRPAAQVWDGGAPGGARLAVDLGDVALRADLPSQVAAAPWALVVLGLFALGLLLRDALALRRLVAGSTPWRRVGGVDVRVHAAVPGPLAACAPRRVVLLDPVTAASPARRALALRHELQHHRQGDPAWAWGWRLLRAALGWNPLVGAWARRAALVEELACDAAVVAHPRVSPRAYGRLLLAAAAAPPASLPVAALSPSAPLHHRLRMLAAPRARRPLRTLTLCAVGLLGLSLAAGAGHSLAADQRVTTRRFEQLRDVAADANMIVPDHPVVHGQLTAMLRGGGAFYARGLARRADHRALVDDALLDAGLPPFLAAVPLVESGYSNWGAPGASEPQSGAPGTIPGRGLWMFIPQTARDYGLRVDDRVDERFDLDKETAAAVALLSDLHAEFGDWGLALAAYNMGPKAVRAAIDAGGTDDPWELTQRGLINDYAASVMAAALLLESPDLVGR
ncbi:MAG: transglycosylase SLT domain-containing protein [Alphaproteobacteria bacterium]|nr:transglycosylase SLT domain-containing protein [Alphaproteobacteria bacterium]